MAIKSSAGEPPAFYHPACNVKKPCKGKVCPFTNTNASEEDENRCSVLTSSMKKRGSSVNVLPIDSSHLKQEGSYTDKTHDGTEKINMVLIKKSSLLIKNSSFWWGLASGIVFVIGFLLMIFALFYSA